ncbi:hypothetical protein [uncultured Sphingorhabdus sp.]|uniref:hypothetical protein n=1 Tax=uncultured Sphingorhabdus sp. TaxID=1686106 RepID=UPI00262E1851|nr:hypothetical protein [uncultured Sphingorhabdus sp.]
MITVALLLLANPPASPNAQQVSSNSKSPVTCQQSGEQPTNGNGPGEYPSSYGAASELQKQIDQATDCLNDADIRSAYGARNQWEEIERQSGDRGEVKSRKQRKKAKPTTQRVTPKP